MFIKEPIIFSGLNKNIDFNKNIKQKKYFKNKEIDNILFLAETEKRKNKNIYF